MERMLVVVFDSGAKAYEASRTLLAMDQDGVIAVHASRVIAKNPDGSLTVIGTRDELPQATMGATAVGSLIGLLGGPVGLALGAAGGLLVGGIRPQLRRLRFPLDQLGAQTRLVLWQLTPPCECLPRVAAHSTFRRRRLGT
jgi:hypothetical protein